MKASLSILLIYFLTFPVLGHAAQAKDKTPPPLVKVNRVRLKNINPPKKYVAHVEAIESVELQARVEGYLENINFREGSFVKEGQLLYVIQQSPYKARVDSAEAEVAQARANLFKATRRLKRLRAAKPESVPKIEMDDAVAARDLAQGKLGQAEAELELARIDLDYTTVEAPISGRIGKTSFDKGDLVSPSSKPLAQIKQVDPIRVVFSVGEKNISVIQNALRDAESEAAKRILSVKLRFSDGTAYPNKGEIEFVDNQVDESTGTIAVWARFNNESTRLIPGEYVKALLTLTQPEMMPVVSLSSVQRDKQGAFVFMLGKGNKVQKRRIGIAKTISGQAAVRSGLQKGEKVVSQGIMKIKPGITVQLKGEKSD